MPESDLGLDTDKTIAEVAASTRFLIDSFKSKMEDLKTRGPDIKTLLRFGVNLDAAASCAKKYFGSDSVEYVAIDGTKAEDQQLDLLVFYTGAFGYTGEVRFTPGGVEVSPPRAEEGSLSASAAIPLSEEDAAGVFGQRRESGVEVDAERLPSALMHLSEYYLALMSVARNPKPKIILLDRTLAGDVAHLVWSTRDFVSDKHSVLLGLSTEAGEVTPFDLELARMLVPNRALSIPAPRSQLLKFAAVQSLFDGEALTSLELVRQVGADLRWEDRLTDDLTALDRRFGAFETVEPFKLKAGTRDYWKRVLSATEKVAGHIFSPGGEHPLRLRKGATESWITADDLDVMVLVLIRALTRMAWEAGVLPVGFIKDTNAFELVKSAVPLMSRAGLIEEPEDFPNFNSDKMLLQTNSVVNATDIPTPWHTIEIDGAFRTMAPEDDPALGKGVGRVLGAYENVIYPERVYLKTYIQLWSSPTNPAVRSHVFTFDRPVVAEYDHWDELKLMNRDGPADVEIHPVLHLARGSDMTEMVMAMLFQMGQEVIPEALGHNYPLFLADKKAKTVLAETKKAYLGAVMLEMAKSDLDQQVLFSRRFRDYRSQIEGTRRG